MKANHPSTLILLTAIFGLLTPIVLTAADTEARDKKTWGFLDTILTTNRSERLKEVVVSAARFEEEFWKSGSSVSVVPESTLKERRPFHLIQGITGEAGVEPGLTINNASGSMGGVSQISMRGLGFSRTQVQVDGLRFNRPIDHIANLSDLPPLLTGNIELLRGPQSSMYGSEAQGGVVSIAAPAGKGKPSFGASFEAGTFNTRRERVFSQGKEESFDWNLEASRLDSDQERPNSNFRQDAGAMRLGYDICDMVRLDFTGRFTDYTTGSPNGLTGFGANDPNDRLMRRMTLLSPTLSVNPFEEWESKLILGYIGVGQRFSSPPSEFVNHSESLQLNWQNTLHVAEWNTLVVGGEARNEHTTTEASSGNNVFNRATEGVYFSDSIRWDDRAGVTLSARFDNNEKFRDAWTWRASQFIRIPMTGTRIHSSFGTAYRAPSISELQPLFGANSGANSSLIPETLEGFDVGFNQPWWDGKMEADVTYFYNNSVNTIATDAAFVFQNLSESRSEGMEAFFKWQVLENFFARGAFTVTSTTSKDRRFSGLDLPRIPRQTASFSCLWNATENFTASMSWIFNGTSFNNTNNSAELNDWNRADLYLTWNITPHLSWFGRAENLLGHRYQQATGFPALGRAFYTGLEAHY